MYYLVPFSYPENKKIQITQNKWIWFSIKLNSKNHIGTKEFEQINWLSTKERVEQWVAKKVFKYW